MGLLHPLTQLPAKAHLWELVELARQVTSELGVPIPPEVVKLAERLPSLAGAVGSGDPQQLLALLGPDVAQALGVELQNPALQTLIQGDLQGAKTALLGYLGNLARTELNLQGQLDGLLGELGDLQGLRGQLDGVLNLARDLPGALSDITGMPILGEALDLIAQHSPELAQVLRMAGETANNLDSRINSAENLLGDLTGKLGKLNDLKSVAELAVNELDGHIDSLPGVFGAARTLLEAL